VTASEGDDRGGKSLLDQALDVLFYAPVGLVSNSFEDLGDLADLAQKGRIRMGRLLGNARVIGRLTVGLGRRSVESEVARWRPPDSDGQGSGDTEGDESRAPGWLQRQPEPLDVPRRGNSEPHLAIPGYEALSASQVVRRLDGLGPDELEAIFEHEAATRRRRTILHRTQQLLGHEDAPGPASWPA
jgi:hypothetical protein